MLPLKRKQFERSIHVHPAIVAQESQTGNFAEVLTLHLLRTLLHSGALSHTDQLIATVTMAGQGKGKGSGPTPKQAAQAAKAPLAAKKALHARYSAPKAPVARPQRKKGGKGNRTQPRGRVGIPNFLDPLCAMPAPSITSDGKALPHTGLTSGDFVVGSTNTTVLLVTNVGSAGTVGTLFNISPTGEWAGGVQMFTIPTLAASDSAGGASAARAMKFSVSVVNCSNALKRGGRVTYLNSSQRLPAYTPAADGVPDNYSPIIQGIKDSPYRRRTTGDCLGVGPGGKATQLIGYPVDSVEYSTFRPFQGTLGFSAFCGSVLGACSTNEPKPRSMSIVAYIFDPVSDPQDYSVTVRSSYYTRWPLTSVPGQSMRNMPTADAAVINHARDHAESTANDLAHVVEGGVLATFGPKIASVARAGAGRLGGMLSRAGAGAIETVGGAATEMLGAEGATLAGDALLLAL